jgi:hypothetical protein
MAADGAHLSLPSSSARISLKKRQAKIRATMAAMGAIQKTGSVMTSVPRMWSC